LLNKTLTTAQALDVLNTFHITDEAGNIPSSVHVVAGTDVLASMITATDPFYAKCLVEKAHKAQLWRFASKGNAGCTEDTLDVSVNDTCFTFRLKPVTEIPAAAG
jgi:hypothetical protein